MFVVFVIFDGSLGAIVFVYSICIPLEELNFRYTLILFVI